MTTEASNSRFEYHPSVIRFGEKSVKHLSDELEKQEYERALVVTGSTVGSNPNVIEPVKDGLGRRLGEVFAETTPKKRLSTAYRGSEVLHENGCDVIVAVGGGSSLDTAKVISVLSATDKSLGEVGENLSEKGYLEVPDSTPPIITVPTTLAGADLSIGAGVTASPSRVSDVFGISEEVSGGVSDPELMPVAVFYDPQLVKTTPERVLAASAINGFNKGIETVYSRNSFPVTDATSVRGLRRFKEGLISFGLGSREDKTFEKLVEGVMLVQYGISRPDENTLSIIHAFGHGLTREYEVQQGAAHAVVTPDVLRYVFKNVWGRRDLLFDALCRNTEDPGEAKKSTILEAERSDEIANEVINSVSEVRDSLDLPSRLRDVKGPKPDEFDKVAQDILDDPFIENGPEELEPTKEEIINILQEAW